MDDIEMLYQEILQSTLGPPLPAARTKGIYEGAEAFQMQTRCISCDVSGTYELKMSALSHDMLVLILVTIRDIMSDKRRQFMDVGYRKRIVIANELDSLGITHMCSWVICHKDSTYTLDIRMIPSDDMRSIAKALFVW